MEIKINDKTLSASLDNENTLGEVLAALEQWITKSGHRITELIIDGQVITASMIESVFSKNINDVKCIDVHTNVLADLSAASLINLLEDIDSFEKLGFDEKKKYFDSWIDTPTAMFISVQMPELYSYCVNTFSSGEVSVQTLKTIAEEIQREINEPVNEIHKLEKIIKEICERLVDLPLDIQTGKDARAAQTIQVFSAVTEKLFRIFKQLDSQGFLTGEQDNEKRKEELEQQFRDFSVVIKDLFEAYEKNDSVLVGDLTEYEASPKLKELYAAISDNIQEKL